MKKLFTILALLFGLSAYGQRFIQTFNSANDAWNANLKSVHTNLFITYRSTMNDGGGGQFWYDPSATTTTNLGTVWGNKYGGRVFRVWDTEVLPQWFGADDTGMIDAAPALQAALNFASFPTYGWQSNVGATNAMGYTGAFTVKAHGHYVLDSEVKISGGAILEGKPGAMYGEYTGHTLFVVRHGGPGFTINLYDTSEGYRIGGIKHVLMYGYSRTYQANKKAINLVTDRLTFRVADADAPPTLDDVNLRGGNNTCFFFDPQGEYLGSARIASTLSSGGNTTVTLQGGTDCYSSINGTAGGALTSLCKVVWPVRVTNEFTSATPAFNDPAMAGQIGVNVKNMRTGAAVGAGNPVLEDIHTWGFHTGFRFGPGVAGSLSPMNNLRSTRHSFAGFSCARPENSGDFIFGDGIYAAGIYVPDFAQTFTSSGSLTVTAATPAVFTKTAHGYIAGSLIRISGVTLPPEIVDKGSYYVSATGLTTDTFQVSASVGGSSVATSSTGSGLYVYGNVIDYPSMQFGTYGIYGAPNHSRYDSAVLEFNALANLYTFQTIAPHFKYIYSDGTMRYGVMVGTGYSAYTAPGSSQFSDWLSIGKLEILQAFSGQPYDNYHSDRVGVYFETTDVTRFAGVAIDQIDIPWAGGVAPKLTHAFDLKHPSYNNRAKVGMVLDTVGATAWYKTGPGKAPEVDTPNLTSATDVYTGWYNPATDQHDFAVTGTRVASFTAGNLQLEASTGRPLTLKSTTSGTSPQAVIGTDIFVWENTVNSLRFGGWYSDSSSVINLIGSSANTGTARSSQIVGESMSGTDKSSGDMYIIGPKGTGAGTSGNIFFQTGDSTTTGTTLHTPSSKFFIPKQGGVRIIASAADITASSVGHINYVSGSINNFRFYDRDSWQPLSPNSAEQSVASASTMQLAQSTSEKIFVTGTTAVASFGSAQSGVRRFLRFESALTMTNSVSLVLPGGANITTAAGDTAEAHSFGSGSWRVVFFQRASGASLVSSGGVSDGDKGDITVSGSGATYTIDATSVSYAKMQNVSAASKLLGRGDSGSGSPQEITLGSGLTMTGTTLSSSGGGLSDGDKGDITVSGGGTTLTVDASAISYSKIQNISAISKLLGRGDASTGPPQEITLGSGLSMSGTTLSAVPAGVADDDYGEITVAGGVWTVDINTVDFTRLTDMNTQRLLGRNSAGIGDPEEVTISQSLDWTSGSSPAFGDVLYRGASSWTRLAPGTSGQFLQTRGVGNSPQWAGGVTTTGSPSTGQAAEFSAAGTITGTAVTGTGDFVKATAPVLPSTVTIGATGGTTGAANIKGTTSGTVTLSVAPAAGTHTIKLPTADGTANQVLKTDGSGQWGWTTAGSGSVATDSIWVASGDLAVGTGSSAAARLAPPTKLSGQALYYGPTGVEWVHPSTHYLYRNDLLINQIPGDWNSNSASGGQGGNAAEAGAVGVLYAATSTASSTYRHNYLGGNNQFALGRGRTIIEWKVRLPNLSDATDTYSAYVGLYDHQTTPVDGAWFEYSHGVNSGNWVCKVANNSSTTTTANTSVAATTSWATFTIDANAGATEVKFYIDGTLVGTETGANIPPNTRTSNVSYGIAKTGGTTNIRYIYADYLDVYVKY